MPEMTPIRVRGKRSADAAEKWHAGKKRKPNSKVSPTASEQESSVSSRHGSKGNPRKQKLRTISLSKLEQLPTEILQHIFSYDPNPSLAAASPTLLAQLKSRYVQMNVTTAVLGRVLGFQDKASAAAADRAAATRLLNSRFMTYEFFTAWLKEQSDEPVPTQHDRDMGYTDDHYLPWLRLGPSYDLLPPKKLLVGPWTLEKSRFLFLLRHGIDDITAQDPIYGEMAVEGLTQAVAERMEDVVVSMTAMEVRVSTKLLRLAVIDAGCDHRIVTRLVRQAVYHHSVDYRQYVEASSNLPIDYSTTPCDVDFLDASLWRWANQARTRGDANGIWLMDLLREQCRIVGKQIPVSKWNERLYM